MIKNISRLALALAFCGHVVGCSESGDNEKTGTPDAGGGGSGTGGASGGSSGTGGVSGATSGGSGGDIHHETGGTSGTGGSGGSGGMMMMDGGMMEAGALHAPIMETVEPMAGGLHVMWMNVTTDCDQIQLLRNKDGGAYEVAYTLIGTAMSQHDTEATSPGTYCYEAVCVKDSMMSPESNEMCGTP